MSRFWICKLTCLSWQLICWDDFLMLGWLGMFPSVSHAGNWVSDTGRQHCTRQTAEGSACSISSVMLLLLSFRGRDIAAFLTLFSCFPINNAQFFLPKMWPSINNFVQNSRAVFEYFYWIGSQFDVCTKYPYVLTQWTSFSALTLLVGSFDT